MMSQSGKIPIPLSLRWQRFRYSFGPYIAYAGVLFLVATLWQRQGRIAAGIGEIYAARSEINMPMNGRITPESRHWKMYELIEQGAIIAQLDTQLLEAQFKTLQQELVQVKSQVIAAKKELEIDLESQLRGETLDHKKESLRLTWQIEQVRIDELDRLVKIQVAQAKSERLKALVDSMRPLAEKKIIPEIEFIEVELRLNEELELVKSNKKALLEIRSQFKKSTERLASFSPISKISEYETIFKPLRDAIKVQESRMNELVVQKSQMVVRSPVTGTIVMVHAQPGQSLVAGMPIISIASQQSSEEAYITVYLRDGASVIPKIGDEVLVSKRAPRAKRLTTKIQNIGPQVEAIPPHHLRDPNIPEWGLPVQLAVPKEMNLHPGSLVNILYYKKSPALKN